MSLSGNDREAERIQQDRSSSPVSSCVSMKSNWSMDPPMNFRKGDTPFDESKIQQDRSDSPVYRSVDSGFFSNDESFTHREQQQRSDSGKPGILSANSHQMDLSSIFQSLEENAVKFLKNKLKMFKKYLSQDYPACCEPQMEDDSVLDSDGKMQKICGREGALKITLYILRTMNQMDLADRLEHSKNFGLFICPSCSNCISLL
nr:uncharacterized protein LOC111841618 isoform X1 [Paramormyrops kingsleyae]